MLYEPKKNKCLTVGNGLMLNIKIILTASICFMLCACFTGERITYTSGMCSEDFPFAYPCRLDSSVVRKIAEASGRKNVCDDSVFCNTKDTSYVHYVSRISESPHCIEEWNSKKEKKETDPLNFVYVDFEYAKHSVLDGFVVWHDWTKGLKNGGVGCYNIKEGVFMGSIDLFDRALYL